MKVLFVAATDFELDAARNAWGREGASFLETGWGARLTQERLEQVLENSPFDMVIDIGIAGSYSPSYPPGTVVQVVTERIDGKAGAQFRNPLPLDTCGILPEVSGNTVQKMEDSLRSGGDDVETMEGAAFFELCLKRGTRFAQIRSISNYVGEEDRSKWDIPLALSGLEAALRRLKPLLNNT